MNLTFLNNDIFKYLGFLVFLVFIIYFIIKLANIQMSVVEGLTNKQETQLEKEIEKYEDTNEKLQEQLEELEEYYGNSDYKEKLEENIILLDEINNYEIIKAMSKNNINKVKSLLENKVNYDKVIEIISSSGSGGSSSAGGKLGGLF
jgi:cell division protein FtsB